MKWEVHKVRLNYTSICVSRNWMFTHHCLEKEQREAVSMRKRTTHIWYWWCNSGSQEKATGWQEHGAAGHTVVTVLKYNRSLNLLSPFHRVWDSSYGMVASTVGGGSSHLCQPDLENPSQAATEASFHAHSKSCQVDNQDQLSPTLIEKQGVGLRGPNRWWDSDWSRNWGQWHKVLESDSNGNKMDPKGWFILQAWDCQWGDFGMIGVP